MLNRIFIVVYLLFSALPGLIAQQPLPDWRSMPVHAYEPRMLQVRLSAEAIRLFAGNELPASADRLPELPVLDSIGVLYGFSGYKKLISIALRPTKQGLDPAENPVLRWLRIELTNPKALTPALEALQQCTPWVERAEPVYTVELFGAERPYFEGAWFPDDTLFARQWHYHNTGQTGGTPDADIDLPEAWEIEKGHPTVLVGVFDNGIDTQHVDLSPNLSPIRGYNFFNGQPGLVPGNHGNHTAGTIGARNNNVSWVSGIAGGDGTAGSGIRMVSCQIFGVPSGSGGLENAFVWSAQNGVVISSNSWGYTLPDIFNQSLLDAIDYFVENGGGTVLKRGLVIFSGGNSGAYERRWPGVYHKVIGVTGSNHHDLRSWYSTYHELLDITAPGGELNTSSGGPLVNGGRQAILSTIVQAAGGVGYLQGTSMAAPHVSGVAALVASHGRGRLSADDVKSLLLTSTDTIDHLQQEPFRKRMGTGRLNAFHALKAAAQWIQQPEVAPPVSFQAVRECSDIVLSWQKAKPADVVMVAVSTEFDRGGLFGMPRGAYSVGDSLPGGGRIIYTGSASSFRYSQTMFGLTYYFKVWTIENGSYSLGVVPDDPVTIVSPVQSFTAQSFCFDSVLLRWQSGFGCSSAQVLIAWNTENSFGIPSGAYMPGDSLGSAEVIFTGSAPIFRHMLPAGTGDSATLFYRIFSIGTDGAYSEPLTVAARLPSALSKAFPEEVSTNFIRVGWERNPCFTGDVMVAFNTTGSFDNPSGNLKPGDRFPTGSETLVLYVGPASEFTHSGLTANMAYSYGVWPVLPGGFGLPKFFAARTRCVNTIFALPFRDTIGPASLSGCVLDTMGFRNFTAGPWPQLSVVEGGVNPSAAPFSGRYMLAFNSFDTRERNEVWLTTPPLRTIGVESVDVSYKWYEDGSDYNNDFFSAEGVSLFWSTDYVNWNTVVISPRITRFGADGWKYKQVTLPSAAANQPVLYVRWRFLSRWGYNCYLDEPAVLPTRPKPTDGSFSYAVAQFTDSLRRLTHFYDTGEALLMSIRSVSGTGHVNDSLRIGAGGSVGAVRIPANGNYVRNGGGWGVTGKYWHISRWVPPRDTIFIRHYYSDNDLAALNSLVQTFTPPAAPELQPPMGYVLQGATAEAVNPGAGHNGQSAALSYGKQGFWQYDSTGRADTLTFSLNPFIRGWQVAETRIVQPGGGGLGKGSSAGNGAMDAHWVTISAERRDKTTLLNFTTGYERRWVLMTVERADSDQGAFKELGFVSPGGWSQQGASYSFTDRQILPNGSYRYRVRAADSRGLEWLSPEVVLVVSDVKGLLVFPNPTADGRITVFGETVMLGLRILDNLGRTVFSAKPNATQFTGRLPFLATGIYFVQAFTTSGMYTTRLFVSP